jgi:hypothetical protein
LPNPSKGWRSSSSRLLALYSFVRGLEQHPHGVLYFEVSSYLNNLTRHSLMQRQHLFAHMSGKQLDDALTPADLRGTQLRRLRPVRPQLNPIGGTCEPAPELGWTARSMSSTLPGCRRPTPARDSCDAVAIKVQDGRWLVLVRDNGSLFVVTRIILHALLWGISLTLIPGFAGWHLLRRRPLKRIRAIQARPRLIVAGDLTHRLPLSAAATNWTCGRHRQRHARPHRAADARGQRRVRQHRPRPAHPADPPARPALPHPPAKRRGFAQAEALDQAIGETDTLMARFRGLLRISELEDRQRRAGFVSSTRMNC